MIKHVIKDNNYNECIDSNVVKTTAIIQSDTSNQDNIACIATIEW